MAKSIISIFAGRLLLSFSEILELSFLQKKKFFEGNFIIWSLTILFLTGIIVFNAEAGLIFYESFDDENAVAANGGTITGSPRFFDGILDKAVHLPGETRARYSMIGNFKSNKGTVQFWVLTPNENSLGYFDIGQLGRANSWGIFKNKNHLIMEIKNNRNRFDQAWSPFPVNYDGKWHFISCPFERNGSTTYFKVCVDGKCKESYDGVINDSNPDELGEFFVGWNYWYGYSNSSFDEFKIYDHVKTDNEILNDYREYVKYIPKECVRNKPDSTGKVKINCSGLFVDGRKFTVKGVGYQPIPIGKSAEILLHRQEMYDSDAIRKRDFSLLRKMNANTVRTWSEVLSRSWLDDLYNNGNGSIYVLMGFWIDCHKNYGDQDVRNFYKDKFRAYVNEYKDHPAVLAWMLGNENNLGYCSSPDYIGSFYSLCNELAQIAYEEEGSAYHPIGIVNGDLLNLGVEVMNSNDESLTYIDFWGINVYPGFSFGEWFNDYKLLSGKPLLITEYGIDAFNNTTKNEFEATHAEWILRQWNEISNAYMVLGSTLMAYSDEWWKAGNPSNHDFGGYMTARHPDNYANEEWWGVMRIAPTPGEEADTVHPRQIYFDLQRAWKQTEAPLNTLLFLLLNKK